LTEEKEKNELAANKVSVHKNNKNDSTTIKIIMAVTVLLLFVSRVHMSVTLEQKTADVNLASPSGQMQWSLELCLTEGKQKNNLAQTFAS
jgi:hypothetical protein